MRRQPRIAPPNLDSLVGSRPPQQVGAARASNARGRRFGGALRAALFRQWRAAGAMTRYLDRFADEYTLVDPRG